MASSSSAEVLPSLTGKKKFEWMIAPHTTEEFLQSYWEKQPLYIQRNNEAYYNSLLSTADIEQAVKDGKMSYTTDLDVTLYKDGERSTLNGTGVAEHSQLWKQHTEDGCSIRLLCPQEHFDGVWRLLSCLEDHFNCFTGANVYLTPAGSQGFAPHYDDIEAFILQLEGAKEWWVYPPREGEELPRYSSPNFKQDEIGEPVLHVTLKPGDLLYFPRGWIHQARSLPDAHSLHITVSTAMQWTWREYLQLLLTAGLETAAEDNEELRRTLPWNFPQCLGVMHSDEEENSERTALLTHVTQLLHYVMENLPIDAAADQIIRRLMHERLPPPLSQIARSSTDSSAVPQITADSLVRLTHENCVRLCIEGGCAVLYSMVNNSRRYKEFDEMRLELDVCYAESVEALIRAYPAWIEVKDLPIDEELEQQDVINVVTDLIATNILTVR